MSDNITIIGSETSPFVRMIRMVAEELGAPYDLELTSFFAKNTTEQERLVLDNNPLMKVPIVRRGESVIFETRVIVAYLLKHFESKGDYRSNFPKSFDEENVVSTILGIVEAGVLSFILKGTHPEIKADEGYLARSKERMKSGLEWLNAQETLGESFGVPETLLVCALDWFKKRNVIEWSNYNHLVGIHARYQDRDSVINTRIPENA